jgi:hypothetical protein
MDAISAGNGRFPFPPSGHFRRALRMPARQPLIHDVWWIDPARCLLFLILPIYVFSGILGGPLMSEFGSSNFLSGRVIAIGGLCIAIMAVGCKIGQMAATNIRSGERLVNIDRLDRALVALTIVTIASHMLLMADVVRNPAAMLAALKGEMGAIYDVKDQIVKLVGVTSFVNITPLVMVLASCRKINAGQRMPGRLNFLFWILVALVLMRGFVAAERFAIVEAAIAYFLPVFSFKARQIKFVNFFPLMGIGGVFTLFSLGEYTRSWAYYIDRYDNFLQFAALRLLGYVSVASNTAAGLYEKFDPVGYPSLTATWFARLVTGSTEDGPKEAFFAAYGNAEYNNPGGVMAGVIDFGLATGLLYHLGTGLVLGWFYGKYTYKNPIGTFGYPLLFIGIVILTQAIYWGDPKFVTLFLSFAATIFYATLPMHRARRVRP